MKITTTLFSLLLSFALANVVSAQLPKGAPAPDFTVDIISKVSPTAPPTGSFSLSAETSQGKAVCMTMSATWCGPCWSFHNSGVMETIYSTYGPSGTNEVAVIFVEADTRTNRNCMFNLSGCSYGVSQGNWMNVPFDMTDIDNNNAPNLASQYGLSYFPTLYIISPDMRVYEIRQRTVQEYESYILHSFKLDATADVQDADCGGDGSVILDVTGGYGNLNYNWSNGAKTRNLIGVGGGSYTVTITDANGYDLSFGPFTVSGPTDPMEVTSETQTNVRCFGIPEGEISLDVMGGTPGYQYNWSNGESGQTISGLTGGTYTVTVTDLNNCSLERTYVVDEPDPVDVNYYSFPENCGQEDGSIEVYGFGGVSPHRYSIGGPLQEDNVFSNLNQGTYTLRVVDFNNCEIYTTIEVESVGGPTAAAGEERLLGCGVDSLRLSGEESTQGGSIVYQWTTNEGNILRDANTLHPEVDAPGWYYIEVLDNSTGCRSIDSVQVATDTSVISRPGPDTLLTCTNSVITLDGSSSTQGQDIIYEWLTENGNIVSGENTLYPVIDAPGIYALVSRDTITMCFDTSRVEVTEDVVAPMTQIEPPATIDCINTVISIDASQSSNGPDFSAVWTTMNGNVVSGENTLMPEVDKAGEYTLTITNLLNGCETSQTITVEEDINEPISEFAFSIDTLSVQFTDNSKGTPTAWSWDFGDGNTSTEQNPSHVYTAPGKYTVCLTITNECGDDEQCEEFEVGFGLILSSYVLGNVSCHGESTGKIDVTIQGGVEPYTFQWSTGSTDEDLFDIPAGLYSLTVTDAQSNEITFNFEVTEPALIKLDDAVVTPSTGTANDGSIALEISGGVLPYEYQWSNGGSEATITDLAPGEYSCIVKDGNGCEKTFGPFVVGTINSTNGFAALNEFLVYPNPVSEVLNFRISYQIPLHTDMRILSATGNVIRHMEWEGSSGEWNVDVSGLSSGIYIVHLTTSEGTISRMITVHR